MEYLIIIALIVSLISILSLAYEVDILKNKLAKSNKQSEIYRKMIIKINKN
jgi:hypothetical protein